MAHEEADIGARSVRFPTLQFFVLFLPVALVILGTGFSYVAFRTDARLEAVIKDERTQLHHISGFIGAEVSSSLNHLGSLATEDTVRQAMETTNANTLRALESNFLTLARRNPYYHQVRWIDETGMEQVRVMRDQGEPFAVARRELQNKNSRYYFTAANEISAGEIYISRLDLNFEHGQIEIPHRPMLRIATPVEDRQSRRRGVIIINIAVKYMLDVVRNMRNESIDTHYMLLNQEGYRLSGTLENDQFEFQLDPGARFVQMYPEIWTKITTTRSGSAEIVNGLWIWETLSPADTVRTLAQALPNGGAISPKLHADELSLTLVAYKPVKTLLDVRSGIRMPVILGAILLLTVYGLSLLFYLRSHVMQRRSELNAAHVMARAANMERLKELEVQFRRLVEASSVGQVVVDDAGRIVMCNPAAEMMFGYATGELQDRLVDDLLPTEQRELHAHLRASFMQSPETRKMGEGRELEAVTKDGRKVPVDVGLSPYSDRGKQLVLANIIDLSEQKLAARAMAEQQSMQERFATILDALPGVVCTWERDPSGRYRLPYANSALREVFGILPVNVNENAEAMFDWIRKDDRSRIVDVIETSALAMTGWNVRFRINHPLKGERWIEGQASPPVKQDSGSLAWYCYLQDVSEQRYNLAEGATSPEIPQG